MIKERSRLGPIRGDGRTSMNSHAAARRRSPVKLSEHIEGDGQPIGRRACDFKIVSKRIDVAGEARSLAGR